MVVTLCKHCGAFVSGHARLFCGVVLGSLGEKEPVVVGPLWEAALLVVDINHVRNSMCTLCMYNLSGNCDAVISYITHVQQPLYTYKHVFLQSELSTSTH